MADLNYKHLRYFWAVAHDGNLTRTADRLNVSQSALSVQIRKLEERLGHPLFERRNRQLLLTEAGRLVLDHADAIFATGNDLVSTLRQTGLARQAIRIGALATLSRNFQVDFLRPLFGRADVDLVLRSGGLAELLGALESFALDLVLTNQPPPADALSPFVVQHLSDQPVSLVGRPHLVDPTLALNEALSRYPLILPTIGSSMRTSFDALIARQSLPVQIAAEVDDMAMMRLLARDGVGVAVLPPIVVKDELSAGTLVELHQFPTIREQFIAVTAKRRFPNLLVQALVA